MTMDVSGLRLLSRDLTTASPRVSEAVVAATLASGLKIRDAARAAAPTGHARRYPRSITMSTKRSARGVEVEIGPDKHLPQGALGNLLEFGSSKNAPHPHVVSSWNAETGPWLRVCQQALDLGI